MRLTIIFFFWNDKKKSSFYSLEEQRGWWSALNKDISTAPTATVSKTAQFPTTATRIARATASNIAPPETNANSPVVMMENAISCVTLRYAISDARKEAIATWLAKLKSRALRYAPFNISSLKRLSPTLSGGKCPLFGQMISANRKSGDSKSLSVVQWIWKKKNGVSYLFYHYIGIFIRWKHILEMFILV